MASSSAPAVQGNNTSQVPAISGDGRYVAIESLASNLVPSDTNGAWDIFVHDRQTGGTQRVSVASDGSQANSNSHRPALSGDGRYLAFISLASNLVPGDTNGTYDAFVHDRMAGTTERVSVSTEGAQANATSLHGALNVLSISRDGRYVAFHSAASNLVLGDQCCWDIFVRDRVAGTTARVSRPDGGGQGNNDSHDPAISADGRYVAYRSAASNIVSGDTCCWDIFVFDRQSGTTERVSTAADGSPGTNDSHMPSITPDGRFVAFWSLASNLVPLDLNGTWDVFVKDRATGSTERLTVTPVGEDGNATSANDSPPRISDDGRYVTYESAASNLVLGDQCCWDVFVRDRTAGTTRRASVPTGGGQGNNDSLRPAISSDGSLVVFQSAASNLVPGDVNGQWDVFVHHLPSAATELVTLSTPRVQGNSTSSSPVVSADGRMVAYRSAASNLVPGDTAFWDVFVHDRDAGTTERVSVSPTGAQANNESHFPALSADGRYVAFYSLASNLVPGDTNGTWDVFIRDLHTRVTERVSVGAGGAQGNNTSDQTGPPAISADGRYVAFRSLASNLVAGDTCCWDIFVRDRVAGTTVRVSLTITGAQANHDSHGPAISADGRHVAFYSFASNLVPSDTNGTWDVFVRDLQAATTERVSVGAAGAQGNNTADQNGPPSLSADGRYVAFRSLASNLVAGDTCCWDTFVRDRQTGTTERVSAGLAGAQANSDSHSPRVSDDGRFVSFYSLASNIVAADTNGAWDVFVRDRMLGATARVSIDSAGAQANGHSDQDVAAAMSSDGCTVAFRSGATNLVPSDTNGQYDIFVHDCVRTVLTNASSTSVHFGETIGLRATLTDSSGAPISAEQVTFEIVQGMDTVRSVSAVTGTDGVAATTLAADFSPGAYVVRASYPGSVLVSAAADDAALDVHSRVTSLSYTGPVEGTFGEDASLTATLTDTRAGAPLAGRPVGFTLGGITQSTATDAQGVATVVVPLTQTPGQHALSVFYDGELGHDPSADSTTFAIARRPAAMSYSGATSGRPGRTANLRATLSDELAGSGVAGRTLHFTLGSLDEDATTDADGVAEIEVLVDQPPGDYALEVSYAGEETLEPASATASFRIGWPYTFASEMGAGTVYIDPSAKEFQFSAPGDESSVKHDPGMQVISLPEGAQTPEPIPTPEPLPTPPPVPTPTPTPEPTTTPSPTPICVDDPTGGDPVCPLDFLPPLPTSTPAPDSSEGEVCVENPLNGDEVCAPTPPPGCPAPGPQSCLPVQDPSLCDLPGTVGCEPRIVTIAYHDESLTLAGWFDLRTGAFAAVVRTAQSAYALGRLPRD